MRVHMKTRLLRYAMTVLIVSGICVTMSENPWFPALNLAGLFGTGLGLAGILATE